MNKLFLHTIFLILATGNWQPVTAQASSQNLSARYEIDAKRIGVPLTDKDALPRSREFIRLDSTYYVGYLFEGFFKYDRAADYLGYKNCIVPLKKSLLLFEKDYGSNLKEILEGGTYSFKQTDIRQICNALYDSYSNVEQPDSAMWILEKVKSWNLASDFMDYHIKAAWTIHRNRYYLNKFSFLKSTVAENEQLALNHLYAALAQGNSTANFYLAIIHNYLQDIDSTEYYYNYLMQNGGFSFNNYAHFKNTLGQFGAAIDNFEKDKFAFDKRLIESYYFLPTLYINSGNSLRAITETNDIISRNGSTPGFGWYNIALARSYLYNGQLDSCEKAIDKAAQFKELHLGTTLGQAQYDFAVNGIKLMLTNQKIERIKFFNPGWWYSITDIAKVSELMGETFLLKYSIVSEFAGNPERGNVIYTLFSSENVIGFDEIWNLIKDISPEYFVNLYHQKLQEEKRENVKRYIQLFYGNFLFKTGEQKESRKVLEDIVNYTLVDTAHEKLFLARLYESLAKNYDDKGDDDNYRKYLSLYFNEYPQLVPFSGLRMTVKLNLTGIDDAATRAVKDELEDCNIKWVDTPDFSTIIANINFEKKKDKYEANYFTEDNNQRTLVPQQKMIFKNVKGAGKELALRIFGVNGPLQFETENN